MCARGSTLAQVGEAVVFCVQLQITMGSVQRFSGPASKLGYKKNDEEIRMVKKEDMIKVEKGKKKGQRKMVKGEGSRKRKGETGGVDVEKKNKGRKKGRAYVRPTSDFKKWASIWL